MTNWLLAIAVAVLAMLVATTSFRSKDECLGWTKKTVLVDYGHGISYMPVPVERDVCIEWAPKPKR